MQGAVSVLDIDVGPVAIVYPTTTVGNFTDRNVTVRNVGTETLNVRLVASFNSAASGSPEASTRCESDDGTKAMLIGLSVDPFWLPVGAGGAAGRG